MSELPEGTLTFLFTDIVRSTRLWEQHPEEMSRAHRRHVEIVLQAAARHGGTVVRSRGEGDSTFSVFRSPPDGVAAALDMQRAIYAEAWPPEAVIRVRAALHTGVGEADGYDYNSTDVNRCARLRGIAHAGQTLLSRDTAGLTHDALPPGASLRDLGLHRLKDLNRPERVYQLLHADLPETFAPLASLNALPNNLPQQLTSFVGREREMAELCDLLAETRALTIAGAGGLGKTRLAIQSTALLLEDHPDGVWLVELAPLGDGALVAPTLAGILGVREAAGESIEHTLAEHLGEKRALIILDNCEHLIDASARLAVHLLQSCPNVRVLATSREPLRIPGETVWRLQPLPVPPPDTGGKSAVRRILHSELGACESVRLFVERARSGKPRFVLTARNAVPVADICRRIDGIPLAIELAAARVPSLGVRRICEGLDDRFRLLTRGIRTALPRQQTLRALIDWSYDLLSEHERAVFRRLAVFSGGWDESAAVAVLADRDGMRAADIRRTLARLVDKSLVVAEERSGGYRRYRMLETIREYGKARLLEAGESDCLGGFHLEYYVRLAEQAEPLLTSSQQAEWFERLALEHDNVRAALAFGTGVNGASARRRAGRRAAASPPDVGVERERAVAAMRLASALWRFWLIRGHIAEGCDWLTGLVEPSRREPASRFSARAIHALGRLAGCQGDYVRARNLLGEALTVQRSLGDDHGASTTLLNLGVVAGESGDMVAARSYFEQSLGLQRSIGDRRAAAVCLQNLGNVAVFSGDLPAARKLFEESLSICQELGDTQGTAIALNNLGHVCARLEDYDTARAHFQASLLLSRDLGYKVGIASCTDELAKLAVAQHDPARASRLFAAAISIREQIDAPVPEADKAEYDRLLGDVRAEMGDAGFERSWSRGRAMSLEDAVVYALDDRREASSSAERS